MEREDDIIEDIRVALNDADPSNYRWEKARLLKFLSNAQENLCRDVKLITNKVEVLVYSGQEFYEIADDFYTHGGKLLLLDEIHKVKDFSAHIKAIYDFTDLQVVFSGS